MRCLGREEWSNGRERNNGGEGERNTSTGLPWVSKRNTLTCLPWVSKRNTPTGLPWLCKRNISTGIPWVCKSRPVILCFLLARPWRWGEILKDKP